jgi:hypothetical protein
LDSGFPPNPALLRRTEDVITRTEPQSGWRGESISFLLREPLPPLLEHLNGFPVLPG